MEVIDIETINNLLTKYNQDLQITSIVKRNIRSIKIYFNNGFEILYKKYIKIFIHNINNIEELVLFNSKFFDIRYSTDIEKIETLNKDYKTYYSKKGCASLKASGKLKGKIPPNKGKTGGIGWSRGLNKTNDPRFLKLSEDRKGKNNPMFGTIRSEEDKQQKSRHMKEIIESGKFTPKTENRLNRWKAEYKGKTFRSSWELCFYYLNPECFYEKLRLRYYDNKKQKDRIYIVDFVDEINKIIYEVRPKTLQHTMTDKMVSVNKYMSDNNYTFKFIDEDYIKSVKNLIEQSDICDDIKQKIMKVK